ncbi:hypothetical protein [Streptomyces sp. NPDC048349]|uniref:hypothetical protein n=1 Tax=Streptomyces sp. NPDC048349 TaxID=3155486 RepID=UPI00343FA962
MNGTLHVHTNHKRLDAWFLPLCIECGDTVELTALRAAEPFRNPVLRRHGVGGSGRTGRPAWQSPYGPPPHRARRGRWAPVPVPARSRPAVRRGHLCGRCE